MNEEAKVGAFTISGVALFMYILYLFGGITGGPPGYPVYAGFSRTVGLTPTADVLLSGVPVGKVSGIQNDGRGVTVTLSINNGVKIPYNSTVTIASPGIMGEKFIIIIPGDSSEYLGEGAYMYGEDELGLDTLFVELNKMTVQIESLLASMNAIVGNQDFQMSIVNTTKNMERITENLDSLTLMLESMARENQGNVNGILANMNSMMGSLNRTMISVERTMANLETVGADPETAANLKKTLTNITEASERIARITEGIESVTGDSQVREDAKVIIHNARGMTDKANGMMSKLGNIEVKPKVDALYSGAANDWRTNFNLEVGTPDTFLLLGVDDIGDGDKVNAQVGKRGKSIGMRAGVVAGEAGLGVDAHAGKKFSLSADVYDPDDPTVRLRTQYRLTGNTYLLGEWNDVNDSDKRYFYTGIRQEF